MTVKRKKHLQEVAQLYIDAAPEIYNVSIASVRFIDLCDMMESAVDEGNEEEYRTSKRELRCFLKACGRKTGDLANSDPR